MKIVVAIGGNALVTPGTAGDIQDQFAHSRRMAKPLADLVERGWQVTITHGNGPQVGSIMRRVEIAARSVYPIDLGLAVADTQAGMGYMLAQTLNNELHHRGIDRSVAAIVTSVVVDANDPAFMHPTKPIGPFLDAEAAERHRTTDGWVIVEDAGRGFRRVVASPVPKRIVELEVIRRLVEAGVLLLAGGGGGIPVIENARGELHGVEAVIDKDLTSAMLAAEVGADVLAIITGVEQVYLDFGKPTQRALSGASIAEVERLIAERQFAEGSMLPKIEAAVKFIQARRNPAARAIITDWSDLPSALEGKTGTTISLSGAFVEGRAKAVMV
ncbi:MAG: carbamate kinase [Planctomycetes bacterium]|nr:carbamate kinase [Planctomycetota bacterium]